MSIEIRTEATFNNEANTELKMECYHGKYADELITLEIPDTCRHGSRIFMTGEEFLEVYKEYLKFHAIKEKARAN